MGVQSYSVSKGLIQQVWNNSVLLNSFDNVKFTNIQPVQQYSANSAIFNQFSNIKLSQQYSASSAIFSNNQLIQPIQVNY